MSSLQVRCEGKSKQSFYRIQVLEENHLSRAFFFWSCPIWRVISRLLRMPASNQFYLMSLKKLPHPACLAFKRTSHDSIILFMSIFWIRYSVPHAVHWCIRICTTEAFDAHSASERLLILLSLSKKLSCRKRQDSPQCREFEPGSTVTAPVLEGLKGYISRPAEAHA